MGAETYLGRAHAQQSQRADKMTDLIADTDPRDFARNDTIEREPNGAMINTLKYLSMRDPRVVGNDCIGVRLTQSILLAQHRETHTAVDHRLGQLPR